NVAARNSRLAKRARPSWTNAPPSCAGAGESGRARSVSASVPAAASQPIQRRSSPRARSVATNTSSMSAPTPISSANACMAPGAEERQQLGDEAGRGGQTQRREAGHGEGRGDSGHDAPEPAHLSDLTRVGLLVDEAHEREAESGHDAVGEHLEDGAIQARLG